MKLNAIKRTTLYTVYTAQWIIKINCAREIKLVLKNLLDARASPESCELGVYEYSYM